MSESFRAENGKELDGFFEVTVEPLQEPGRRDIYTMKLASPACEIKCIYRPALPTSDWLLPSAGENVYATMYGESDREDNTYWRIEHIIPENIESMMRSFQWSRCRKPEWISTLGYLIERYIQSQHIINFLAHVFGQEDIMNPFLRFRASAYVHHAEYGGLFEHSVKSAVKLAEITEDALDPLERDCCIVGMLFHDIGKIAPVYSQTGLLRSKDHPFLIGPILSDALARLKDFDRTAWEMLQYVFGVIGGYYSDNRIPLTKYIRPIDQYHAAEDARYRTFDVGPFSIPRCLIGPTGQIYYRGGDYGRFWKSEF